MNNIIINEAANKLFEQAKVVGDNFNIADDTHELIFRKREPAIVLGEVYGLSIVLGADYSADLEPAMFYFRDSVDARLALCSMMSVWMQGNNQDNKTGIVGESTILLSDNDAEMFDISLPMIDNEDGKITEFSTEDDLKNFYKQYF